MKTWKRPLALLLSLALTASLCACGSDDGDVTGTVDPDAGSSIAVDLSQDAVSFSAGLSSGDVLLTVNGEDVPADLFLHFLYMNCDYTMYQYYSRYGTVPDSLEPLSKSLMDSAVKTVLYRVILRKKAIESGCVLTDEQLAEVETDKTGENQGTYEQYKAAYGLTDGSMEFLSASSYYYENLLDAMVPTATDEMLNNYVYQVKHILLRTVDTDAEPVLQDDGTYAYPALPAETVAAQRALAEDILAQLQAVEGEEQLTLFDELMNQYSEDSGLTYYPDGYEYTVEDSLVDGFTEAALALEAGQISGIVETDYGYHIMLRGEVTDLKSYADDCRVYQLDKELYALTDTAEVTRAPALDALDVDTFYHRYFAYFNAVMEQYEAEGAVG